VLSGVITHNPGVTCDNAIYRQEWPRFFGEDFFKSRHRRYHQVIRLLNGAG